MALTHSPASREDIPHLVQILFLAFANDPLLMTCYPATSDIRQPRMVDTDNLEPNATPLDSHH